MAVEDGFEGGPAAVCGAPTAVHDQGVERSQDQFELGESEREVCGGGTRISDGDSDAGRGRRGAEVCLGPATAAARAQAVWSGEFAGTGGAEGSFAGSSGFLPGLGNVG